MQNEMERLCRLQEQPFKVGDTQIVEDLILLVKNEIRFVDSSFTEQFPNRPNEQVFWNGIRTLCGRREKLLPCSLNIHARAVTIVWSVTSAPYVNRTGIENVEYDTNFKLLKLPRWQLRLIRTPILHVLLSTTETTTTRINNTVFMLYYDSWKANKI